MISNSVLNKSIDSIEDIKSNKYNDTIQN